MRYVDYRGHEMRFFSVEIRSFVSEGWIKDRDVQRPFSGKGCEIRLYDVRTGEVFFKITRFRDKGIPGVSMALPFFESVKDGLCELCVGGRITDDEAYSYDKWIKPLFREKRMEELGI